jgi:hypothetical protein
MSRRVALRRASPPLKLAMLSLALLQAHGAFAQPAGRPRRPAHAQAHAAAHRNRPAHRARPAAQPGHRRPDVRPPRPGDRGRRQCDAAARPGRHHRRPARVLPARRPRQGQGQRAGQPGRQRVRRARARTQAGDLRGLLQQRALPVPGERRPRRCGAHRFRRRQRLDRPARHLHHLPPRRLSGLDAGLAADRGHDHHRHRRERGRGHQRAPELHGHQHAADPEREFPAVERAQERPPAAHHRRGQHQRHRDLAAVLLEHRAQPRRHDHADDHEQARPQPGHRVPVPGEGLQRQHPPGPDGRRPPGGPALQRAARLAAAAAGQWRNPGQGPDRAARQHQALGHLGEPPPGLRRQGARPGFAVGQHQHQPRQRQRLLARLHAHADAGAAPAAQRGLAQLEQGRLERRDPHAALPDAAVQPVADRALVRPDAADHGQLQQVRLARLRRCAEP